MRWTFGEFKLSQIVIFGEGKNDIVFLHEVVTNRLNFNPSDVKIYHLFRSLEMDIRNQDQKPVSIVDGGGSFTPKRVVRYSRKYWYETCATQSIGVMGDLDRGSIYAKVVGYFQEYLRTKCKEHNIHPTIATSNSSKELAISVNGTTIITIWTLEIPCSLEVQISCALKRNYPKVKSVESEDEVIDLVAQRLKISKDDVIRRSVSMVAQDQWFQELEKRLRGKLSI